MKNNITKFIGNTPVLKIPKINGKNSFKIYAKADFLNPSGSIKDVMAYYMMKEAESKGELKPGMNILEVTTGNTGIAFSMLSKLNGYNFTAVMPEHMSKERIMMMKAYGANVVLTPKKEDMPGALAKYEELKDSMENLWLPKQFDNRDNILAHKKITGKEILRQVEKIDIIVAGIGTGGTLFGAAEAIKQKFPNLIVVGVEPEESAVLNGKDPGIHNIQGIGEGFIPPLVEKEKLDDVIEIRTKDAESMARNISTEIGLLVGISSGANILASLKAAEKYGHDKHIVTILPDRGERYLSTGLFSGN